MISRVLCFVLHGYTTETVFLSIKINISRVFERLPRSFPRQVRLSRPMSDPPYSLHLHQAESGALSLPPPTFHDIFPKYIANRRRLSSEYFIRSRNGVYHREYINPQGGSNKEHVTPPSSGPIEWTSNFSKTRYWNNYL